MVSSLRIFSNFTNHLFIMAHFIQAALIFVKVTTISCSLTNCAIMLEALIIRNDSGCFSSGFTFVQP